MLYSYPLSFDSSKPLRRSLIVYPLYALLIFQSLMFIICGSVLSRRISAYLLAGLALEVLITLSTFEFSKRKPWDGREQKIDQVIEEHQDRLFESISSYHFGGYESGGKIGRTSSSESLKNGGDEGRTDKLKLILLQHAYEDPNERVYNEGFVQ